MTAPHYWAHERRIAGLWRSAVAITVLNVFGYVVLGFEQAWIVPVVVLGTAYPLELALEVIEAWASGRSPRFRGGVRALLEFLLPTHISALAVGMLIYTNEHLWPM